MQRLALALGLLGLVAAGLSAPGHLMALGLGILAIGTGWVAYRRRTSPGAARLVAAAAIALGVIALLLGVARVVLTLIAIAHVERLVAT